MYYNKIYAHIVITVIIIIAVNSIIIIIIIIVDLSSPLYGSVYICI